MAGSSSQESENESYVDPVQQDYNRNLYANAQHLFTQQANMKDVAQNALSPLYDDAYNAYANDIRDYSVSNDVADDSNQGMQTLLNLQEGGVSPLLDNYYESALGSVNRNLERNILPSIRDGAISAGQSGSSRHGIAEGLALSDANQQATEMANQMYGQAYDADQGRRLASAGQYIQSGLGAEGQSATQASNVINSAGQLYDMQLDPYSRAWDPLNSYKSIVGNQTILGEGSSSGSSWNIL